MAVTDNEAVADSGQAREPRPADERRSSLVVFRVGATWLACLAEAVEAIVEVQAPTPVPLAPAHVAGLVGFGERALAVLHLSRLLGLTASGEEPVEGDLALRRTLVVRAAGMQAGLICDRAVGVLEVRAAHFQAPSVLQGPRLVPFLKAEVQTPHGLAGVLDLEALLASARVKA